MTYENIEDLMQVTVKREASDLHIKVGSPPSIRLSSGELVAMEEDMPSLTPEDAERLIKLTMDEQDVQTFSETKELDYGYDFSEEYRFRVNVFMNLGAMGAVYRAIPAETPTIDGWGLPQILKDLAMKQRGFVLVTGPTGFGKSTTLAAMVEYINTHRRCHIVTMEDPVEFVFKDKMSRITQREVGADTNSFSDALGHVLRQDPDVIMVGEMRDCQTIGTAMTAAETGHLVLSTLHTNSSAETVDRIIDVFPPHQQPQIRTQLAFTIEAALCQTLLPKRNGTGRVASFEIMLGTPAVRNLIRERESHQIINVIQTRRDVGMQTRDQSLRSLYEKGIIDLETAVAYASYPEELKRTMMWTDGNPPVLVNS